MEAISENIVQTLHNAVDGGSLEKKVKQKKEKKVTYEDSPEKQVKQKKGKKVTDEGGPEKQVKQKKEKQIDEGKSEKQVKQKKEKKTDEGKQDKRKKGHDDGMNEACDLKGDKEATKGKKRKNDAKGNGMKKKQIIEIEYVEDESGIKSTAHQKVVDGSLLHFTYKRKGLCPVNLPIDYTMPHYNMLDCTFSIYGYVDTTIILESGQILFTLLE